jgi:hypothetical protein
MDWRRRAARSSAGDRRRSRVRGRARGTARAAARRAHTHVGLRQRRAVAAHEPVVDVGAPGIVERSARGDLVDARARRRARSHHPEEQPVVDPCEVEARQEQVLVDVARHEAALRRGLVQERLPRLHRPAHLRGERRWLGIGRAVRDPGDERGALPVGERGQAVGHPPQRVRPGVGVEGPVAGAGLGAVEAEREVPGEVRGRGQRVRPLELEHAQQQAPRVAAPVLGQHRVEAPPPPGRESWASTSSRDGAAATRRAPP